MSSVSEIAVETELWGSCALNNNIFKMADVTLERSVHVANSHLSELTKTATLQSCFLLN